MAGVRFRLIEKVPLATLALRQHQEEAALAALVHSHFYCALPATGGVSFGPRGDLVWAAPGQWLVVGNAADLRKACAGLAAIVDQGSSRAMIEVSGHAAREALSKGFPIDLHSSVFAPGSTATTSVAHMSVQIWQADGTPRFVIAVPRSFAGSFWSWLEGACACYGYEVAG